VEIATNYNGDGTICVAVRDYGSGPEPTQERLFEHFFTTKRKVWMGLAIVLDRRSTWGKHRSRKRRWRRRAFSFSSAN
jgi:C4-dicarboxylate-specific signal transduction histidine kinase